MKQYRRTYQIRKAVALFLMGAIAFNICLPLAQAQDTEEAYKIHRFEVRISQQGNPFLQDILRSASTSNLDSFQQFLGHFLYTLRHENQQLTKPLFDKEISQEALLHWLGNALQQLTSDSPDWEAIIQNLTKPSQLLSSRTDFVHFSTTKCVYKQPFLSSFSFNKDASGFPQPIEQKSDAQPLGP